MKNTRKKVKPYKPASPARKLLAALVFVGDMMEALLKEQSSMPSNERVEKLGKYFVAVYFKPLGELHECFFDCLKAVGRVDAFDSGVCAGIERRLDGFWPALAKYLDDGDLATDFSLLVEGLLDLSRKNLAYHEGAKVQQQLHANALSVFERICKLARKRELSLSHPSQTCYKGAGTCYAHKEILEVLDLGREMNAAVQRMDVRHKRAIAAKKASDADDAMERLKKLHPRHHKQILEVIDILIGKDKNGMARTCLSQRRNYSSAANRLFAEYRETQKALPAGGYKSAGSLYSFIHVNKADFFKLLEAKAKERDVELPDA